MSDAENQTAIQAQAVGGPVDNDDDLLWLSRDYPSQTAHSSTGWAEDGYATMSVDERLRNYSEFTPEEPLEKDDSNDGNLDILRARARADYAVSRKTAARVRAALESGRMQGKDRAALTKWMYAAWYSNDEGGNTIEDFDALQRKVVPISRASSIQPSTKSQLPESSVALVLERARNRTSTRSRNKNATVFG